MTQSPSHFFERELAGEPPLRWDTAREVHALSMRFFGLRPWLMLDETQLVLIEDASGQRHACSVMGELGEHTALAVYIGAQGCEFFHVMHSRTELSAGEFYALQHSVSAYFDWPSELTKPDREFLRAFGYTRSKGQFVPIFRTIRPGYHPWYITQGEGELLAEGLRATLALVELLKNDPPAGLWSPSWKYPLMIHSGEDAGGRALYRRESAAWPRSPEVPLARPELDERRLARILSAKFPSQESLELDEFWGVSPIGRKTERKSCIRGGAAINAVTGYAYPPRAVSPEVPVAQLLADVLLEAIEKARFRPRKICVRTVRHQAALLPLTMLLGCKIVVTPEMPALDFFKRELLASMGERGSLPL